MIAVDFSKNWKLYLQEEISSLRADEYEKADLYLVSEHRYIIFVLNKQSKDVIRISGSYELNENDRNSVSIMSFDREISNDEQHASSDLVLPFFLLFQYLNFRSSELKWKCTKYKQMWTVEIDDVPLYFRSELAAKTLGCGVPLEVANALDASSEEEQKVFFEVRKKAGELPYCFSKLGVSWITKLIPIIPINKTEGSTISKKFS